MKYNTTAWFKYFDIDENGKPLSNTEWHVTLLNGQVYKSEGWDNAQVEFNKRKFANVSRQTKNS